MSGTSSPSITHERQGAKGRYVALIDGIEEPAELTYSIVNDHLIIADHTGVPDAMRGMGVGRRWWNISSRMRAQNRSGSFRYVPM